MDQDTSGTIPPKHGLINYIGQLITPAVIVAFISGATAVIAAYLAAGSHIDKTICGITSAQMRDAMQKLELYQVSSNTYLSMISSSLDNVTNQRTAQAQDIFWKLQLKKQTEAIDNHKAMPMPYEAVYSAQDIINIMKPFTETFQVPSSSETSIKSAAALDGMASLYAICPK